MAITFDKLIRPAADTDYRQPGCHRKIGLAVGPTTDEKTGALAQSSGNDTDPLPCQNRYQIEI